MCGTLGRLRSVVRRGGRGGATGGAAVRNRNAPPALRQNINFNGSYSHSASDQRQIFLPLGGATDSTGYALNGGVHDWVWAVHEQCFADLEPEPCDDAELLYGLGTDPAAAAGVFVGAAGVQANPFFDSVPTLSFTNFTGLGNTTPSDSVNQTISFSDFVSYRYKKHNLRFGGDIRRLHADSIGGTNVQGAFTFTGYATQAPTER